MKTLYAISRILIPLLGSALLMVVTTAAIASEHPNIVVFVADDAGWDDFGAYGHPAIRTPTIDALARAGWTADNAFLTTPQCSPSRISILTGKHPHQTGAEDLHVPLPSGYRIVPSYLSEAGYFTGDMQKQHYGPDAAAQFDWYSEDLDINAFLDAAKDKPFFLWVGFHDPHRTYGDAPMVHSPDDVRLPPTVIDTPETRADFVRYYDEIARMDSEIARFLEELEDRELRDNTYVVFISDNGAPMPRAKGTLYDAGIKTPMIVTGPGVKSGVRYSSLLSVVDLAPTILELAGLENPDEMIGASIRASIFDPSLPGRNFVFSQRNWHNTDEHMRSIRSDRYKLIWNNYIHLPHGTAADITASPTWQALRVARDDGELTREQALLFEVPRPRVELYDVTADPMELTNLAADLGYRDTIQKMMARLEAWMIETGDVPPSQRRRDDNTDRITGAKFTMTNPPLYN